MESGGAVGGRGDDSARRCHDQLGEVQLECHQAELKEDLAMEETVLLLLFNDFCMQKPYGSKNA